MKKTFILLMLAVISASACAQYYGNYYKFVLNERKEKVNGKWKIVKLSKKDVKYFKILAKVNPPQINLDSIKTKFDFWRGMQDANREYVKVMEKMEKETGYAKKARRKIAEGMQQTIKVRDNASWVEQFSDSVSAEEMEAIFKEALAGEGSSGGIKAIKFAENKAYNAACMPDGFIFVNTGIIDDFTVDETLFVLAHEYSHYVFQHMLLIEYANAKEQGLNAAIIGATAVLYGAATAYNAGQGIQPPADAGNIIQAYGELAERAYTFDYTPKYTRNQEYEADITAMRFLKFIGADPRASITALRKIQQQDPYADDLYDDDSDHPTTKSRMQLLEYMIRKGM